MQQLGMGQREEQALVVVPLWKGTLEMLKASQFILSLPLHFLFLSFHLHVPSFCQEFIWLNAGVED